MSKPTTEQPREKVETGLVAHILKNHPDAMALVALVTRLLGLWSGLERGRTPPLVLVRIGLWGLLAELPCNPFYQEHLRRLHPIVCAIGLDLIAASDLERHPDAGARELQGAFSARQSWCLLLHQCAYIIGGYEWAMANAADVRWFANSQPWDDYLAEVKPATQAPA